MDEPTTMPVRAVQKPSVGRIVHFYEKSSRGWKGPTAAMVTAAFDDSSVDLTLFYPGNEGHAFQVYPKPASLSLLEGNYYWEWPPRV